MNKYACISQWGLGLLLILPTSIVGAQKAGDAKKDVDAYKKSFDALRTNLSLNTTFSSSPAETQENSGGPEVNWNFQPGQRFGGFGGGGGGGGSSIPMLLGRDRRWKSLTTSVDVQLDKATLTQAVSALNKSSEMSIFVAENMPDNGKRLTIDARNVPLGTVLEAIAQQLDLMIAPYGETHVTLKPWPSISINGQKSHYRGPNAPWSDEWAQLHPAGNIISTGGGLGGFVGYGQGGGGIGGALSGAFGGGQGNDPTVVATLPEKSVSSPSGLSGTSGKSAGIPAGPGMASGVFGPGGGNSAYRGSFQPVYGVPGSAMAANAAPLSMTISGDRLVVAEPASGPKGEAGYRLTVYNIAGSQMKIVSSAFHASANRVRSLPGSYGGGIQRGGGGLGGSGGGLGGGGSFGGGGGFGGGGFGGSGADARAAGGGLGGNVKPADKPEDNTAEKKP